MEHMSLIGYSRLNSSFNFTILLKIKESPSHLFTWKGLLLVGSSGCMHSNGYIESWKGFFRALNVRLGLSMYEDHIGALSKLQQSTIVANYRIQFLSVYEGKWII